MSEWGGIGGGLWGKALAGSLFRVMYFFLSATLSCTSKTMFSLIPTWDGRLVGYGKRLLLF